MDMKNNQLRAWKNNGTALPIDNCTGNFLSLAINVLKQLQEVSLNKRPK